MTQIEDILQTGAQIVVDEARMIRLECSPAKSELLVLPAKRVSQPSSSIKFCIYETDVPAVSSIKMLGLIVQSNRANTPFMAQLASQVNQTVGLMRRISACNKGLNEAERIRLIQAFVVSRITHSLPYLNPSPTELIKVNCLIRKVYKTALQIPRALPLPN